MKFMKVLYESLLSDFTELCDQYGTVISSILDKKQAPEMCIRKSLWPYAPWYITMKWAAENNLCTLHLTISPILNHGLL